MRARLAAMTLAALSVLLLPGGGQSAPEAGAARQVGAGLVGQWRAHIEFHTGAFAAIKDLEFMYVFNAGGTMTESSNYDAVPPVPPAYGIWRQIAPNQFEARYEFYVTQTPSHLEDIMKDGGWPPAGRGVFSERITLSDDGKTYTATIHYEAFDRTGKAIEGGGDGTGTGLRLTF